MDVSVAAQLEWVKEMLRALEARADLCAHQSGDHEGRIKALEARLAAVRALPDAWRDAARSVNDPKSPSIFVECAEELQAALRD